MMGKIKIQAGMKDPLTLTIELIPQLCYQFQQAFA